MRRLAAPAAAFLLAGLSCERAAPPAAPVAAPEKTAPWTWRGVGGYIVIEGELAAPARLVLEGPHMRVEADAAAGPVRWEMERPAPGETADLRTADGKVLARFRFADPPRPARRGGPSPRDRVVRPDAPLPAPGEAEAPAAPRPAPEPPPPVAAAVAPPDLRLPAPRPGLVMAPAASRAAAAPPPETRPAAPPRSAALPAPAPAPVAIPARAAPAPGAPPFPGAGEALNLVHGPRTSRRLVLTFDGGSGAESAVEILDTLKARRIRTTFFLTATFIQKFPDLVRRMAAEGHELGNHSTTHPHMAPKGQRDPRWTKARVQAELLDADACLVRLLGRPMDPYWRAPYGEHTAEIRRWAEEIGYRHVGWSEGADSLDWATPQERKLYRSGERILDKLHARIRKPDAGGLIVLMHLGSGRDEEDRPSRGLGAFIDRAMRDGWRFVTVGEYLRDMGKPAWDPAARMAWLEPALGGAARGGGQPR